LSLSRETYDRRAAALVGERIVGYRFWTTVIATGIGGAGCGYWQATLSTANMPAAATAVRMIDANTQRILCAPRFSPHVNPIKEEVVLLATPVGQPG
jgi:hypothetical protein